MVFIFGRCSYLVRVSHTIIDLTNYQVAHLHDIEGLNIFEHCLFSRFTRESDMGQNRYLYDEMYEIFIIYCGKNAAREGVSSRAFQEFAKRHPAMLFPAFELKNTPESVPK